MAAAGTLLFINYFVPICSLRLTLRLLASGPGKVLENPVDMEGLYTRLPAAIHVSLAATWCLVYTLTTPRT